MKYPIQSEDYILGMDYTHYASFHLLIEVEDSFGFFGIVFGLSLHCFLRQSRCQQKVRVWNGSKHPIVASNSCCCGAE